MFSFSTIDPINAKRFLEKDEYKYLNDKAKEFCLNNLHRLRVQDPMMHAKPVIEIMDEQTYNELMALCCSEGDSNENKWQ